MTFAHRTVLLEETVDSLKVKPGGIYVDGTLGGGGHSYEILKRNAPSGRLIGIDQDSAAITAAGERLSEYGNRAVLIKSNYCNIREILSQLEIEHVSGILLDLGVSSYQFDNASRGFSYREDAPLDMRMDQEGTRTAADLVNCCEEYELYRIIRDYGEDPFAKNIAKHIVRARKEQPIRTTFELVEVIKAAVPMRVRKVGGHPAKRTFQALRIELNAELEVLKNTLEDMIDLLEDKGRIAVITFHSLEDRIVKGIFRKCENPCICPPDFPVCNCGRKPKGVVITRKPLLPGSLELEENPRSKSAKLRVLERTAVK